MSKSRRPGIVGSSFSLPFLLSATTLSLAFAAPYLTGAKGTVHFGFRSAAHARFFELDSSYLYFS
jgi:hypothetical protein